jgi:hypothetical protein
MPRSSASMPVSRYSGMKRMAEVWKPRHDTLPAITIVTQTSTKMPYSKLPIQRARKTWLTKRDRRADDADGEGDERHAAGLALAATVVDQGIDAVEKRLGTQNHALRQQTPGRCGSGKAHAIHSVSRSASTLCRRH